MAEAKDPKIGQKQQAAEQQSQQPSSQDKEENNSDDTQRETNQKKFSNWLQSVQSLQETKKALHEHVLLVWRKSLMSLKENERAEIPTFIACVANGKIKFINKKWDSECKHQHCVKIMEHLLDIQQNKGFRIVWNSNLCEKVAEDGVKSHSEEDKQKDDTDNIQRAQISSWTPFILKLIVRPFEYMTGTIMSSDKNVDYEDIFKGCKEEHIWCIANMFMQRGNAKTEITNKGPEDTDASMFFQMMKNCKLFEIENNNDLYDDVLLCRNKLHHSANNRIQRKEAVSHVNIMKALLEHFADVQKCKDATTFLEKMLKETILAISVPEYDRKMVWGVLKLKKNALEVDKEAIKDKGFSNDETDGLLIETTIEMNNSEDPRKPLNDTKSREDYRQESQERMQKIEQVQGQLTELEGQNKRLKNEGNEPKRTRNNPDETKNPKMHFEMTTSLLTKHLDNPKFAAAIEDLAPVLDQVVDEFSAVDATFRDDAKEVAEKEKKCQDNGKEAREKDKSRQKEGDPAGFTELDSNLGRISPKDDNLEHSHRMDQPHVWSVKSKQTYNIKEAHEEICDIVGCCRLPSDEILLADINNIRLKKVDASYKVTSSCKLPFKPWAVSYVGNNEAVVSGNKVQKLQFVDVASMKLTRSVDTEHMCKGLTSRGDCLYVTDRDNVVYMYSTDGKMQSVLCTLHGYNILRNIAVAADASKLYITEYNHLITIDTMGNKLCIYSELANAKGVCVDGRGHVLICNNKPNSILQLSSDGKSKLGTLQGYGKVEMQTVCFDADRSILVCAGCSDSIIVLHLK